MDLYPALFIADTLFTIILVEGDVNALDIGCCGLGSPGDLRDINNKEFERCFILLDGLYQDVEVGGGVHKSVGVESGYIQL